MKILVGDLLIWVIALLVPQIVQAQEVVYLSNLGQPSVFFGLGVRSDEWQSAGFNTGSNPGGYALNSIQLAMNNARGTPSGSFTVMLYTSFESDPGFGIPGSWLGSLDGSSDPSTSGIYAYTTAADLTLLPNTRYFIVLTCEVNDFYEWEYSNTNFYNPSDSWRVTSSYWSFDGSSWGRNTGSFPQFAINATAIPEPSTIALLVVSTPLLRLRRHGRIV